jgi:hypothetical protein
MGMDWIKPGVLLADWFAAFAVVQVSTVTASRRHSAPFVSPGLRPPP